MPPLPTEQVIDTGAGDLPPSEPTTSTKRGHKQRVIMPSESNAAGSPAAWFAEGRRLYRTGDFAQAKVLWQRAADAGYTPALSALENLESHLRNTAKP